MQTRLIPVYQEQPEGKEAEAILRNCVHCGFCNATCPTYQALGNELDGPRGRIYLIKQMLEGKPVSERTRVHLDRCLSCRACETTCPSGVDYHRLLDIGRGYLDQQLTRPLPNRLKRWLLARALGSPVFFRVLLGMGRMFRPVLPRRLREKVPPRLRTMAPGGQGIPGAAPVADPSSARFPGESQRKVLMVTGCVQDALAPDINIATKRVLGAFGFDVLETPAAECCGAMSFHLGETERAHDLLVRNVESWWRLHQEHDFDAIVVNASGCGLFVKDYPQLLQAHPDLLEKANSLSALTKDPVEVLEREDLSRLRSGSSIRPQAIAFHPPCTLQHGLKLSGRVEALLSSLGIEVLSFSNAHLCCGSAGTYSILQADLSRQLRSEKLAAIEAVKPDLVLTANIGCQSHLAAASGVPIKHWLEFVSEMLTDPRSERSTL